jgi:Phosphotransferase enzyme family
VAVTDVVRAVAAARAVAADIGLRADDAIVLQQSNRLAVRLLPCDGLVRVSSASHQAAAFEVDLAAELDMAGAPVGALDPRVPARVYERDGFDITFWTYYESHGSISPADYADALARLHAAMRAVDIPTPHVMDRVDEAAALVASAGEAPPIDEGDRAVLASMLDAGAQALRAGQSTEQLLHGEPHPGNVLATKAGPLFIDLETCCRGPVEFDVAHAPHAAAALYAAVDAALLAACRGLVLAMAAAWRLDPADEFPMGAQALRELLVVLRAGPPYPPLGAITGLR